MNGYFVTATDTGVGKTVVTATITAWLRQHGSDAVPMKPVQTGYPEADDLAEICRLINYQPPDEDRPRLSPYRFRLAASPHLAAEQEEMWIDTAALVYAADALRVTHQCVVAEGAGGVLVPLNDSDTMLDLIKALRLPAVLVARPGLGTLNHTLLTVGCLRQAGVPCAGIIFNAASPTPGGLVEASNLSTLRARTGHRVVAFRHIGTPASPARLADNFGALDELFAPA